MARDFAKDWNGDAEIDADALSSRSALLITAEAPRASSGLASQKNIALVVSKTLMPRAFYAFYVYKIHSNIHM